MWRSGSDSLGSNAVDSRLPEACHSQSRMNVPSLLVCHTLSVHLHKTILLCGPWRSNVGLAPLTSLRFPMAESRKAHLSCFQVTQEQCRNVKKTARVRAYHHTAISSNRTILSTSDLYGAVQHSEDVYLTQSLPPG